MATPHFCEDKNWINLSEWFHIIRGKWEDLFTIQLYLGGEDLCGVFIIQLHSLAKVWSRI